VRIQVGHWLVEAVRSGRHWVGRAEWRGPGVVPTRYTRVYGGSGGRRRAFEAAMKLIEEGTDDAILSRDP
jgi:hypothetical protein